LQHFGEITKNILDEVDKEPFLILSYATRINAEQALARGRQFKEKTLTVNIFFTR
jgi:RNA-binding protein 26